MEGFNSKEEVLQSESTLYTGLAKCEVVALNPTMEEAKELGLPINKDPNYADTDNDGNARVRHDVWLKLPTTSEEPKFTKIAFFITDKKLTSKTGKTQWKNDKGQFGWAEGLASKTYDWFSEKGEREAYPDEEALDDFMRKWGNADANAEFNYDFVKTFKKGEPTDGFKEFYDFIQRSYSDNTIDVLLIIQNGQYQGVYKGKFGRGNTDNKRMFASYLRKQKESSEKNGYTFNVEFQNSLELQPYTIDASQVFDNEEEKPKKKEDFNKNELPF